MNSMDIPFPEMQYNMLSNAPSFNLIHVLEHSLAQAARIDMVVRLLKFSDEDFESLFNQEVDIADITPMEGKLYEINYIRDCRLRSITPKEWEKSFGPQSATDFLTYVTDSTPDSYVRILNIKAPDYSLRTFNSRYKVARNQ